MRALDPLRIALSVAIAAACGARYDVDGRGQNVTVGTSSGTGASSGAATQDEGSSGSTTTSAGGTAGTAGGTPGSSGTPGGSTSSSTSSGTTSSGGVDAGPDAARDSGTSTSTSSGVVIGRPFVVENVERVAPLAQRSDWSLASENLVMLEASVRDVLAAGYAADALAEHASVAAFARFTMQLLALGAPPDLLVSAHEAGLDEIEHARLLFSVARRFGRAPEGPGPMHVEHSLATSLEDFARMTASEGCVGETVGAAIARESAQEIVDPALRAMMARIAEDEARHAALAWRAVTWAVRVGGASTLAAVEKGIEEGLSRLSAIADPPTDVVAEEVYRAYGRPTRVAESAARVYRDVIAPCMLQVGEIVAS